MPGRPPVRAGLPTLRGVAGGAPAPAAAAAPLGDRSGRTGVR